MGIGKSRNKETRNETKRHFKVERSRRSCACAPSLMVLPDRKGSEYPLSLIGCRLMLQGRGGGGGGGGLVQEAGFHLHTARFKQ